MNKEEFNYKTNMLILLLYLIPVYSDESSGSIFSYVNVTNIETFDPSDERSSPPSRYGAPILGSAFSISTGEDEVTSVPQEDPNAEQATIPEGDKESVGVDTPATVEDETTESATSEVLDLIKENQNLSTQNAELTTQNNKLENLLALSIEKLEAYRLDEFKTLSLLTNEMENLDIYYKSLLYEPPEISTSDTGDDELEASVALVFLLGLGLLFLLLQNFRLAIVKNIEEGLWPAQYALVLDVSVLGLLWCVTAIIDYLDVFEEEDLDLNMILIGFAIYIFCWLILGILLIFIAQGFGRRWQEYEEGLNEGYVSADGVQYGIMRMLFINPVYLPTITESILRSDFDMSEYLIWCIGSIISRTYYLSWLAYSFIIVGIVLWRIVISGNNVVEFVVLWGIPTVIILTCWLMIRKLKSVYNLLVPNRCVGNLYVKRVAMVTLQDIRGGISIPIYLKGRIPAINECEDMRTLLVFKGHPMNLTFARFFLRRYPSRHELLFWLDSYGPQFLIDLVQALCVLSTLWITVLLVYYIEQLIEDQGNYSIISIILASLLWLLIVIFLLPKVYYHITLTTKIEQMKDRELVRKVVAKQKKKRIIKIYKIYRDFKLIYRESKRLVEVEENPEILFHMKRLLEEVFMLVASTKKQIHVSQLDEVLRLLGIFLKEDELRVFAYECEPVNGEFIMLEQFKEAIKKILASQEYSPDKILKYIVKASLKLEEKEDMIGQDRLRVFLEYWSYFLTDQEAEAYFRESEYLGKNGDVDLKELARQLKVELERMPK